MRRRRSRKYSRRRRHKLRSRRIFYGGNPPPTLSDTTTTLATTLATNFIRNVGAKMGIDVTNPQQTTQALNAINHTAAQSQMKTAVANAAETGAEILQAAEPFIDPLIDKTIEEGQKAASKVATAAVKIGLNTAEEIPGVGVLIGTARSLSNAGEALTSVADAAANITNTAAQTVEGTKANWDRLQAEKAAAISRTQQSIRQFGGVHARIPML